MKNEYKKPYYILFAALEDIRVAIEKEDYPKAKALIELAQLDAEEAYISFDEKD